MSLARSLVRRCFSGQRGLDVVADDGPVTTGLVGNAVTVMGDFGAVESEAWTLYDDGVVEVADQAASELTPDWAWTSDPRGKPVWALVLTQPDGPAGAETCPAGRC
ncbi:hypothetical protein [Streptomyces sp. HC307]|uniref:hypothetical protein n=1 Tax=Streptomyces flavusporus TaxID=3385496 RepID=UPI003916D512